jgi:Fe-S-cluster containining protein
MSAPLLHHFSCTQCGRCCKNLRLPLTLAEALDWLQRGTNVQLICEAMPWAQEPAAGDGQAAHRRRRSFAAMSGSLPTRVIVVLTANLAGACPHLQSDMRCGIYERRPLVCRIYPAEINPFITLDPAKKSCPPEAWTVNQPLFQQDRRVIDDVVRRNIQESRDADAADARNKGRLCAALKLNCASLADEGYVVYSPDRATLAAALADILLAGEDVADSAQFMGWRFVSNSPATIASLARLGAAAQLPVGAENLPYEYLPLKSPAPARIESARPPVC